MGGRGSSSGFTSNSLKNMTRNQLADRVTELSKENMALFKKFFRKPEDKFKKERALYKNNSEKMNKIKTEISERDRKEGINQRSENQPEIRATTTYDRARKRRKKKFDAWFGRR